MGRYNVKEIANFILDYADSRSIKLSNMSLNKLAYFAYEYMLFSKGISLTGAKIEAWDHGPVFREIYSSFKNFGSEPITTRASSYNSRTNSVNIVIPSIESDDERAIIESIESLIDLPAYVLREISHHSDGPWAKVWHHTTSSNPGMQITDEIILQSSPTVSLRHG